MSTGTNAESELEQLAGFLRSHSALRAKNEIKLVSEVLGAGSWVHGPGDDGAVVATRSDSPPVEAADDQVIVCGEALLPGTEQYQSGLFSNWWSGGGTPCDIVISDYGWRYTYTVPDPPEVPVGAGGWSVSGT